MLHILQVSPVLNSLLENELAGLAEIQTELGDYLRERQQEGSTSTPASVKGGNNQESTTPAAASEDNKDAKLKLSTTAVAQTTTQSDAKLSKDVSTTKIMTGGNRGFSFSIQKPMVLL